MSPPTKNPLYQHLRRGKSSALTAPELAIMLSVPEREVREVVRGFRRSEPAEFLCADAKGYYFAANHEEMDEQLRHFRSRAIDMLETHRALRLTKQRLTAELIKPFRENLLGEPREQATIF